MDEEQARRVAEEISRILVHAGCFLPVYLVVFGERIIVTGRPSASVFEQVVAVADGGSLTPGLVTEEADSQLKQGLEAMREWVSDCDDPKPAFIAAFPNKDGDVMAFSCNFTRENLKIAAGHCVRALQIRKEEEENEDRNSVEELREAGHPGERARDSAG